MIEDTNLSPAGTDAQQARSVRIDTGTVTLNGLISLPTQARGIVILAHGTDPNEYAPSYDILAQALYQAQVGSLDLCLFTEEEQRLDAETDYFRANVGILEQRLRSVGEWLLHHPQTDKVIHNEFGTMSDLINGYFGVGACGTAALIAAERRPDIVRAVVAVQAQIDQARDSLSGIRAPTMLIAWQDNADMLKTYQDALALLAGPKQLEQVQAPVSADNARSCMEEIADLAARWFERWLEPIV
jgi:putative phosphoribosyl transferase